MNEAYLTVAEVASELRVSQATIRRSISTGKLEVYRVGSQPQIRISRDQLKRYLGGTHNGNGAHQPARLTGRLREKHGNAKSASVAAGLDALDETDTTAAESSRPNIHEGRTAGGLTWKVLESDVVDGLRALPAASVNCIVTSPPYYWQRDYEVDGQIGHEESVEGYVEALRSTFQQAMRVLRDDGVLFLNIGDTYYSAKGQPHGKDPKHRARQLSRRKLRAVDGPGLNLPRKSLIGIPWRVALALQQDGWVLRSSIIWQRPAPMPEPTAHDRPWRTHEPIFLFSKQPRYWFNRKALNGDEDIWVISARPYNPGSHFAPYPLELADRCIRAGAPDEGVVLDPFVGSGTTMLSALSLGRSAIGIDLKPEYCNFIVERLTELASTRPGLREGR